MTRVQARDTAREILEIIPLVMRTVAAELRAAGEMPAPAHFGLLSILSVRPRMLSDLASGYPARSISDLLLQTGRSLRLRRAPDDGSPDVLANPGSALPDAAGQAGRRRRPDDAVARVEEPLAPLDEDPIDVGARTH